MSLKHIFYHVFCVLTAAMFCFVNNILLEFWCVFYASVIILDQWEDGFGYTGPPNSHTYIILLFNYVVIIYTRFLLCLFLLCM